MNDPAPSRNGPALTDPAPTDPRAPLPPTLRVRDGLDAYLTENGFDEREYTAPTFRLKVWGRTFDAPNSPDRQWAIPLHDLHHLATGYGTDFIGEAEIGAWELRAGCKTWVVYYLNAVAVSIGLVLSPRRVLTAFRTARGAMSLYRRPLDRDTALKMTIGELRAHLGVPEQGVAVGERRLHTDAQARRDREREQQAELRRRSGEAAVVA